MLRYATDRAKPSLVAFHNIRPGNRTAGLFLQPRNPHGALCLVFVSVLCLWKQ